MKTDVFELHKSDLNGFLFADIGLEASGMPLSVFSLLARLELDPWQEAGRLARLPRVAAADGLARLIAAMPASMWPMSDAAPIAAKLITLLPVRGNTAAVAPKIKFDWRLLLLAAVTGALLAQSAVRLAAGRSAPVSISAPIQPPTGD